MSKLTKQNVGGIDYTMVGCTLTGVCASSAADFVKAVTLSDGDQLSDGMSVVVTFANGNTAGNAPVPLTIYSSDQVNYYTDSELTQPFTLAPAGCYDIEYTGTGNAYTYISYPVIQVGEVSAPLCDSCGKKTSGAVWDAGDSIVVLYTMEKFMLLPVKASNTVTGGLMQPVTSNAVAQAKYTNILSKYLSTSGWYKIATFKRRSTGASISIDLFTGFYYQDSCSHKIQINYGWLNANVLDFASDGITVFDKIRICYNSNNDDDMAIYAHYTPDSNNYVGINISAGTEVLTPVNFETDSLTWANTIEYNLGSSGLYVNGQKATCLKEKQIRIDDTSGYSLANGVYVKAISNFFTDNGIDYSKVVNIRQVNNGNDLYPYFFISYGAADVLKVFKFANINNTYVDVKVYYK